MGSTSPRPPHLEAVPATGVDPGTIRLPDPALELSPPARLWRHVVELDDGHRVGVAVAGHGVPFVLVHGFGTEALLYAQPLGRLAALGFRVVAIDAAGHGDSGRLGGLWPDLGEYAELIARTIDHLGIERAVLSGHSMGGRLALEVAADHADLPIGLVLLDAIAGEPWERLRSLLRWSPPAVALYGLGFLWDVATTAPVTSDLGQSRKLLLRALRTITTNVLTPWKALTPGLSIMWAEGGRPLLDAVRDRGVPTAVIHGDRDLLVPLSAGRDVARHTAGQLVTVQGGNHSWMLRCPETFPAIMGELLEGPLGDAIDRALEAAGVDPATATHDEMEAACVRPGARLTDLGAEAARATLPTRRRPAQLGWRVETVRA